MDEIDLAPFMISFSKNSKVVDAYCNFHTVSMMPYIDKIAKISYRCNVG